jgi:hypothetical protein
MRTLRVSDAPSASLFEQCALWSAQARLRLVSRQLAAAGAYRLQALTSEREGEASFANQGGSKLPHSKSGREMYKL